MLIEKCLGFVNRGPIQLYPDEINLYQSREKTEGFCARAGFQLEYCGGVWLDAYTYTVVVMRKSG